MTKKCPKRNPNQFLYCDFFIILIFRKLEQNFDEGFSFPPGCNLIKQFQSAAAGNYSTPEKAVHSDWLKISMHYFKQPNHLELWYNSLSYFLRGSITVWLTSYLTGLDLIKLVNLYLSQHKLCSWILTSQTGGQLYGDTSPYEVNECTLIHSVGPGLWVKVDCG